MAIVTTRYRSVCLNGFVTFTAVLPFENFGEDYFNPNPEAYRKGEPMKTLYLLHGVTGDEEDWLYGTRIARYAEEHHMAVIMPAGRNNFYVDNCSFERWGEFIGKELVDVTRGMFNLSDRREDTFICGLSMGGYGALRNGLKYYDTFGKVAALSAALIFYDLTERTEEGPWLQGREYAERMFGDLSAVRGSDMDPEQLFLEGRKDTPVFLAIGESDFLLDVNRRFHTFLESHGANVTYLEEPGAHEWDFWDRNIVRVLDWLAGEQDSGEKCRSEVD